MKLYPLFRSLLFLLPPETAHRLTLEWLRVAGNFPPSRWMLERMFAVPAAPVEAFGLTFPNCLGLAAGYDKDALAVSGLAALGFGHLEIGTVTPRPQPGNPRPRLFRLPEDQAIINRMGFPSQGRRASPNDCAFCAVGARDCRSWGLTWGKIARRRSRKRCGITWS
jgi:dihydroorotate dehydrogenase